MKLYNDRDDHDLEEFWTGLEPLTDADAAVLDRCEEQWLTEPHSYQRADGPRPRIRTLPRTQNRKVKLKLDSK